MTLSLLLLLHTAQPAAVPVYPAKAVLSAFGDACQNVANLKTVEKDLSSQGWTVENPSADSPLGQLLAVGRSKATEVLDQPDDKMSDTRIFTKNIAGERLDIILSSVQSDGTVVNGCRLYDVGEERRIDLDVAKKWVGRDADKVMDREELSVANWSPGYADGHDSFEIYYIPAGSPVIELIKFNGIGLKADFVGEIE